MRAVYAVDIVDRLEELRSTAGNGRMGGILVRANAYRTGRIYELYLKAKLHSSRGNVLVQTGSKALGHDITTEPDQFRFLRQVSGQTTVIRKTQRS
jgi:hypothetical protein